MPTFTLTEVSREIYGHDDRAINRYHKRRYRAPSGRQYILSRTLDGIPPFFEAYGPFDDDCQGLLPRLLVASHEYWGDGWSWRRALVAFRKAVQSQEEHLPASTTKEVCTHAGETGTVADGLWAAGGHRSG